MGEKQCFVACPPDAPRCECRERLAADDPRDQEIARLRLENTQLRETNRRLNRRATGQDAFWQGRAMQAEAEADMWRRHSHDTFNRMSAAFLELRDIFILVEAARGNPVPRLHSVNDCCHPAPTKNPGVYANVFIHPVEGGVRSERVVEAVRAILGGKPGAVE